MLDEFTNCCPMPQTLTEDLRPQTKEMLTKNSRGPCETSRCLAANIFSVATPAEPRGEKRFFIVHPFSRFQTIFLYRFNFFRQEFCSADLPP